MHSEMKFLRLILLLSTSMIQKQLQIFSKSNFFFLWNCWKNHDYFYIFLFLLFFHDLILFYFSLSPNSPITTISIPFLL